MNDLQELISSRMAELDLSYRKAAAKSGGLVSHGTLNSIVSGRHSWKLDDRTIIGIAAAIDVEPDRVRKALGRAGESETVEFVLPPKAARLSPKDRRAVLVMIDALLAASDVGTARRAHDPDDDEFFGRRREDATNGASM